MGLSIAREDPRKDELRPLVEALDSYLASLYPAESNHLLGLESLARPEVAFLVARRQTAIAQTELAEGEVLGTAALIPYSLSTPPYGEIKRMYVPPKARGLGVAKALLIRLEEEAAEMDLRLLRLETGIHQPEALGLYRSWGFAERGPFGSYEPDPLSLFMEKTL